MIEREERRIIERERQPGNGRTEPLRKIIRSMGNKEITQVGIADIFRCIIGTSAAIQKVKTGIRIAAPRSFSVLITGDSGTGKELVAMALHLLSQQMEMPFVAVNCGAIPNELAESILFGHIKGSFTGATREQQGKFEAADNGTLFLDEIGDLPLTIQAKVLRALEAGEIERIGSNNLIPVHVRVIAATHRNVEKEIEEKRFRADLLHRIAGYRINVPALSERKEDIPFLADYFLRMFNEREEKTINAMENAWKFLAEVTFPGNIRQLRNVIECAAAIASFLESPITPNILLNAINTLGSGMEVKDNGVTQADLTLVDPDFVGETKEFPGIGLRHEAPEQANGLTREDIEKEFQQVHPFGRKRDWKYFVRTMAIKYKISFKDLMARIHSFNLDIEKMIDDRRRELIIEALASSSYMKTAAVKLGFTSVGSIHYHCKLLGIIDPYSLLKRD